MPKTEASVKIRETLILEIFPQRHSQIITEVFQGFEVENLALGIVPLRLFIKRQMSEQPCYIAIPSDEDFPPGGVKLLNLFNKQSSSIGPEVAEVERIPIEATVAIDARVKSVGHVTVFERQG
nr:hypothetical protein Iba_chr04cCG3430 [Ipomoea batatas]